ncbi:MAG: Lrp/AsnC ligand binding domain-containing protein [Deltaproteobacteria bacterium]|mgnify:CR=1 FL=1|jgi:Lrp/AsnC family transcriptional regulator, leucine-responsive regulatory protein|nr:Lrp/AsnC ligand binding domain-containing protein [Deltaproteobacteria bacterium]
MTPLGELSISYISGEADYLLQIVATNLDSFEQFMSGILRKLPGVTSLKSSISLREIKSTMSLPIYP